MRKYPISQQQKKKKEKRRKKRKKKKALRKLGETAELLKQTVRVSYS